MSSAPDDFASGVRAGDRRVLAKAITLLESVRPDHREQGQALLDALLPETGGAVRVGLTGPPGVGKSSFIETLGLHLIESGSRLAVLAVDPSSPVSGGSILGDKTRMERLSREPNAFIRPQPSGGTLGGVAHRTREVLLLCEAAGFDVVIVETVGVGQSEVEVRSMVDFFGVLLQPGSGDELQGIKKGVMELADGLIVNKADGALERAAERTRGEFELALGLVRPSSTAWSPRVQTVSALTGKGVAEFWQSVLEHRAALRGHGELERRRTEQAQAWLWRLLEEGLLEAFRGDPEVREALAVHERAVLERSLTPPSAARRLLDQFLGGRRRT